MTSHAKSLFSMDASKSNREEVEQEECDRLPPNWQGIFTIGLFHVIALKGLLLIPTAKIATLIFVVLLHWLGALGITAGVHRLWSHRAYKANTPLRVLLLFCNTIALQFPVIYWARDHRVHHKFSDTNADPYNIKRGFLFAHILFLCLKKHPDVIAKGKTVDTSDLENDPLLAFQKKYYVILGAICCYLIPTLVPYYFWGESLKNAFFIAGGTRWMLTMHSAVLINSAAHTFGYKPYNKNITPTDHLGLSVFALGEGSHNYHHSFPWDYKTSEFGAYSTNLTTCFIDMMAKIGWAWDLKTASPDLITACADKTGDKSRGY